MWKYFGFLYNKALGQSLNREGITMCAKLDELKGLSAEEKLKMAGQEESVPVDLNRVVKVLGLYKEARDFSDIEKIEKRGKISGLVIVMGDDVKFFLILMINYAKKDLQHHMR